jgi:hypothetical protein
LPLDPAVVRVVVAMRDSGDELEPEPCKDGRAVLSGRDGNRQRSSGAMRQPKLAENEKMVEDKVVQPGGA